VNAWILNPLLWLMLALSAGLGLVAGIVLGVRSRRRCNQRMEEAQRQFTEQMGEHARVEENLRRTLAMFQLTLDVAAAAGAAQSLDEAMQSGMDIICMYTGWPVGHVLRPEAQPDGSLRLVSSGVWHLEDPHAHEAFLRRSEQNPLARSKGLPGRAWTTRRVSWIQFAESPQEDGLKRRALEAGLNFGIAIPVFHEDDLVAVLEFFSPPVPNPNPTALDALAAAGEQLGRVVERLEAQELMAQLNQRLVELNEEKNQFLGIASHDLKNPLNAIALMAGTILMPDLEEDKWKGLARTIIDEAHRCSHLIQRLLDVSAIESGKFQMTLREVSLVDAMVHIQGAMQLRAESKGQAIQMSFPEDDIVVLADEECLYQVLDNLVGNALKFMPKGPPVRTVHLSCSLSGDQGVLEVRDEGPGFSEEDLAKAFGRFTRLRARPTGGESSTGLGLSIVHKLMRAMAGEVGLESQLGRGATFRISLPLAGTIP